MSKLWYINQRVTQGGAAAVLWYLTGGIAAAKCKAAYAVKGAASLAASYINLTGDATYDITTTAAPTWNATNGWIFAAAEFLKTAAVNDKTWTQIIRFSDYAAGNTWIMGSASSASTYFMMGPRYAGVLTGYMGALSIQDAGPATAGVVALANFKLYLNGAQVGTTAADAWSGTNTQDIYIGAWNNAGTATGKCACYVQHAAIYSDVLTDTQILELSTAMAAL